jgi:ATP diphosphatase
LSHIEKLLAIMARLRDPEHGCPWDLEQSFETIVPHTLEEAYEVAETIETGDMGELCDELGDLLFQVVFYARLAEEQGLFDFAQVVQGISEKLERRHPHVFGQEQIPDAKAQSLAWEAHKAQEREAKGEGESGTLDGIAGSLPALVRAIKLQKRAARVGFDWPDITPVFDKVREELDEVEQEVHLEDNQDRIEDEIGDLIFACTNLGRLANINPETALRRSNRKFETRFAAMEKVAKERAMDLNKLDLETWDQLWTQVKENE